MARKQAVADALLQSNFEENQTESSSRHFGDRQTGKRFQSIASLIPCKFLGDPSLPVKSNSDIHLTQISSRYPLFLKGIMKHCMFLSKVERNECLHSGRCTSPLTNPFFVPSE